MSWFDNLFGQDNKETETHTQTEISETPDNQHSDIYRRPRGKFRFPIDLDDSSVEQNTEIRTEQVTEEPVTEKAVIEERKLSQQFVNDDYFEKRRARKNRNSQPPYEKQYQKVKEEPPRKDYKRDLPRIPDKKRTFTASEVPSAIFGSRKNLQPSDSKVVITPLTGKKVEKKKPEIPTYRQKDNVVNVENIYASQIVAEIRKEREKKMNAKKAFEEARRQQKEQEKLVEILTSETQEELEIETIELQQEQYVPIEVEEIQLEKDTLDQASEELVISAKTTEHTEENHEEASEEAQAASDVVYTTERTEDIEARNEEQPEQVQDIVDDNDEQRLIEERTDEVSDDSETTVADISDSSVSQGEEDTTAENIEHLYNDQQQAVLEEKPATQAKKVSPFNVLMTPSDKKRLMNRPIEPVKSQTVQPGVVNSEPAEIEAEKAKRKGPKYLLPPVSLLTPEESSHENVEWVEEQRQQLDEAFYHFNVPAKVEEVVIGPSVTRYELSVEKGVKVSRITNLQDDIKMALAAKEIRIEAPIPGTSRVGVEVPNINTRKVNLSEVIFSKRFKFAESNLVVALGAKINNEPMLMDIAKMPHALIAGATGSGKSVSINAILLSLLYRNNPNELKLLLIDPKMVELAPYNDLPHLIAPVITDVKAATESLKWVVEEMERRYKVFSDVHVRNITAYNQKSPYDKRMPKIVIVIDELADLMMMAPQDVEHSIARIAQKARAAGIHMILATQRPSVNVITGLIKANVPTRIAFMVSSSIDSRTILDNGGAEKLLGNGDMLYQGNGMNKPIRIQGCYVSDEEIDEVVAYIKEQAEPNYLFQEKELLDKVNEVPQDELFDEVVQFMLEEGHISTSQLQRRFQIGYNRAARIIDSLEAMGYISGANGSKPRTVLISENQI
ncbi:DNA translocase FtsK [Macrococcus hajekii]|uniref:DNA translocase FtsK n=1 Tax=Macrococcus hajekii TaxID=198482 RepID=A0A4R6BLL1_9STAP|nr:DNA translocase FtsK [Macrococcus hajekii]TDM02666.1 DNA translocase FtsK [Macrococcus hajekii]GGB02893.1 hypothetical protein GCM10007190_08610 [Macrococcus hajekii]